MDLSTLLGLAIALIGILGGLILEGGNLLQVYHPTSALIVLGGTFGSVMVNFPLKVFMEGMKQLLWIFFPKKQDPGPIIEDMVKFAGKARKEGIISLEADAKEIKDEFFQKALMMAIDGAEPKELRDSLELKLHYMDQYGATVPKVWEQCGGFAPTIGIIGAVMGLIQVMGNLEDIAAVGRGIAGAFVATIYGVAFANILFIPAGGKLALIHKKDMVIKEMIIEGILLVMEGVNPMIMRDKLSAYFVDKIKGLEEQK